MQDIIRELELKREAARGGGKITLCIKEFGLSGTRLHRLQSGKDGHSHCPGRIFSA